MHAMRGAWSRAFLVAAAIVLIVGAGQVILQTTPYPLFRTVTPQERLAGLAIEAVWVVAVVTLMVRQPTSQLWKIILLSTAIGQTWLLGYLAVEPRVLIDLPTFLVGDLWAPVFIHLVLAYPSGRLPHRFDRRFVAFAYGFAVAFRVVALVVQPGECSGICDDPIRFLPSTTAWDVVRFGALGLLPILMLIALAELWRHWRAAGPGGRRALAPMLFAAPLWCATTFAAYFADTFLDAAAQDATHTWNPFTLAQALAIPVAIIVGALRARLARGNVAALAVQLGRGVPVGELRDLLARALRDPSLVLAFPAPGLDGLVDAAGHSVPETAFEEHAVTRIEHDGELLAVFVDDPATVEEDPGLVDAVGSVARMALENERLAAQVRAQLAEVQASRQRIVEAADSERRRVERDLHDGAQQRLVALAMRLDLARSTTGASADLLDDATAELRAAVAEVRDLARGLHPTILSEAGLRPSIEALAERTAIPVTVVAPDERFPGPVESAAYFIVSEALTNVARYAAASAVRVTIHADGDRLSVVIRDDGKGGADPSAGSGLRGLTDRVAALGGSLDVKSPPGGGTTIVAQLPLPA
jgi:signal transduction histidine kinase